VSIDFYKAQETEGWAASCERKTLRAHMCSVAQRHQLCTLCYTTQTSRPSACLSTLGPQCTSISMRTMVWAGLPGGNLSIRAPCHIVGYGQDWVSTLSATQKSTVDLGIIIKRVNTRLEHKTVVETTNGIHAPTSHGGHRHDSFPSQSPRAQHPKPAERWQGCH